MSVFGEIRSAVHNRDLLAIWNRYPHLRLHERRYIKQATKGWLPKAIKPAFELENPHTLIDTLEWWHSEKLTPHLGPLGFDPDKHFDPLCDGVLFMGAASLLYTHGPFDGVSTEVAKMRLRWTREMRHYCLQQWELANGRFKDDVVTYPRRAVEAQDLWSESLGPRPESDLQANGALVDLVEEHWRGLTQNRMISYARACVSGDPHEALLGYLYRDPLVRIQPLPYTYRLQETYWKGMQESWTNFVFQEWLAGRITRIE